MKKIIYLLIVLGLSFQMTSCEKSEDESYSSMIVGTWRLHKIYENGYEHGTTIYDENDEECPYVMFKKDGTGMYYEYISYRNETDEDWFTWSITDNLLNIRYNEDILNIDSERYKVTIKTLTDENLTLEYVWLDLEGPNNFWREYYVRVK